MPYLPALQRRYPSAAAPQGTLSHLPFSDLVQQLVQSHEREIVEATHGLTKKVEMLEAELWETKIQTAAVRQQSSPKVRQSSVEDSDAVDAAEDGAKREQAVKHSQCLSREEPNDATRTSSSQGLQCAPTPPLGKRLSAAEKSFSSDAVLASSGHRKRPLSTTAEEPDNATRTSSSEGFQCAPTPALGRGLFAVEKRFSSDAILASPGHRKWSLNTSDRANLPTRLSKHDPRGASPRASICGSDLRKVVPQRDPIRRTTWAYSPSNKCLTERASFQWCQETGRRLECEEGQDDSLELLAVWQGRGRVTFGTLTSPRPSRSETFLRRTLRHVETSSWCLGDHSGVHLGIHCVGRSTRLERVASRCVTQPGSTAHLVWNALSILLIGHDLVMIPLQAFNPPASTITLMISWSATIFWTVDIVASFLVGFHADGVIEMSLRKIATHYARTWLPLDLSLVVVDWCLACAGAVSASMTGSEHKRIWRLLRFIALLRLLRLLKMQGALSDIMEHVRSEFCLIIFGIMKLILLIMLASHLIACGWYGIGTMGEEGSHHTWVQVYGLHDAHLLYRYTTSLHWSVTQFTPASMEVFPQNAGERVFAVCVLMFAMVTFSSFISSITNAMTQLRNLNRERHEQLSVLRRYLVENRVSGPTMIRIWGCLQQAMDRSRKCLHEQDVSILQLLPWSLKSDLQEEIYAPVLGNHPLFLQFGQLYPQHMQRVYQGALQELSLGIGKQLFNIGETADRMFFVRSGGLNYSQEEEKSQPSLVASGQWVCEAVLWVKWKHSGQLVSTMSCELIAVQASKLHDVLQQSREVVKYARQFAAYFRKYPKILSDIYSDQEVLQNMVQKAFCEDGEADACDNSRSSKTNFAVVPESRNSLLSTSSRRLSIGQSLSISNIFGFQGPRRSSKDSDLERSPSSRESYNRRPSFFGGTGLLNRMPSWKKGNHACGSSFDETSNNSADSDTDSSSATSPDDKGSNASIQSATSSRSNGDHLSPLGFDRTVASLKKVSQRRSTNFAFAGVSSSCSEASITPLQSKDARREGAVEEASNQGSTDVDFLPNLLVSGKSPGESEQTLARERHDDTSKMLSQGFPLQRAWG